MSIFCIIRSFADLGTPFLTTLHGRLDLPDLHPFYRAFSDLPLVSISNHQRKPMPPVNWVNTVHHGLPKTSLRKGDGSGGYLAFLGRISPEKGSGTSHRDRETLGHEAQDRRQSR